MNVIRILGSVAQGLGAGCQEDLIAIYLNKHMFFMLLTFYYKENVHQKWDSKKSEL